MGELNDYLWEALYILKGLYDHGKLEDLLRFYRDREIDGDDFYEMATEAIGHVFEDTRCYYNEEKEIETYVFFDPLITEFFRLCEQYEKENGMPPENNDFRQALYRSIRSEFQFNSYSYDFDVCDDTSRKNGCRIVLLLYCEFCTHYEVVDGLLEVYDSFAYYTRQLQEALGMAKRCEIISMPVESRNKEAA